MATNALAILYRKIDERISTAEAKAAATRLDSIPLHAVLRRQLAKVFLDDSRILGLV